MLEVSERERERERERRLLPMPKRTESQWEKAYKDLLWYVTEGNLCEECQERVDREVGIIKANLREGKL